LAGHFAAAALATLVELADEDEYREEARRAIVGLSETLEGGGGWVAEAARARVNEVNGHSQTHRKGTGEERVGRYGYLGALLV